jgi:hypothetical protein
MLRTISTAAILSLAALFALTGCKNSAETPATVAASSPAAPSYGAPPSVDVGLTVEQAYAAIPHRRTIWSGPDSTAAPDEKSYLNAMFQLVDQAIALRVAALEAYTRGEFGSLDFDAQFDRLLTFARATQPPKSLVAYHNDIVTVLTADRQFFQDWKTHRSQFAFAGHIENHPSVRAASAASRAAYDELMHRFPTENSSNRDAFFDYHCALDFL